MFGGKKGICGKDTLYNGQHQFVLQTRVKSFVLQRFRVYYISLQFNSVVCNSGFFQSILTWLMVLVLGKCQEKAQIPLQDEKKWEASH